MSGSARIGKCWRTVGYCYVNIASSGPNDIVDGSARDRELTSLDLTLELDMFLKKQFSQF